MSDDELIMLWCLDGMELWEQFKRNIDVEKLVRRLYDYNERMTAEVFVMNNSPYITLNFPSFLLYRRVRFETLYMIEDVLSFNPDERWWKLLFAKLWYSKNKDRFIT